MNIDYDPMGNIETLKHDGVALLTGDYREAGRPNSRTLTLTTSSGGTKTLTRTYGYKSATGQLEEMRATITDGTSPPLDVAGSHVQYDGLLVNDAQLLGVSANQRHTTFGYDARGRLRGTVTAANGSQPPPQAGSAPATPGAVSRIALHCSIRPPPTP